MLQEVPSLVALLRAWGGYTDQHFGMHLAHGLACLLQAMMLLRSTLGSTARDRLIEIRPLLVHHALCLQVQVVTHVDEFTMARIGLKVRASMLQGVPSLPWHCSVHGVATQTSILSCILPMVLHVCFEQ